MTAAMQLDQQCINTLRFLSMDMVQKANSGHSACRSAPRRWLMCCGRTCSGTTRITPIGSTATVSCFRLDTIRRYSTAFAT